MITSFTFVLGLCSTSFLYLDATISTNDMYASSWDAKLVIKNGRCCNAPTSNVSVMPCYDSIKCTLVVIICKDDKFEDVCAIR